MDEIPSSFCADCLKTLAAHNVVFKSLNKEESGNPTFYLVTSRRQLSVTRDFITRWKCGLLTMHWAVA